MGDDGTEETLEILEFKKKVWSEANKQWGTWASEGKVKFVVPPSSEDSPADPYLESNTNGTWSSTRDKARWTSDNCQLRWYDSAGKLKAGTYFDDCYVLQDLFSSPAAIPSRSFTTVLREVRKWSTFCMLSEWKERVCRCQ